MTSYEKGDGNDFGIVVCNIYVIHCPLSCVRGSCVQTVPPHVARHDKLLK